MLNSTEKPKQSSYSIRNANNQDAQHIADLIFEIWNNEYHFKVSREDCPDLQKIEESYQSQGGSFWVAVENQKIIGTVAFSRLNDSSIVLKRMFVEQKSRGRGIAQALLDQVLRNCPTGVSIYLSTKEDVAISAQKLYLRNDFKKIERNDLPQGFPIFYEDDLFMKKSAD